MEPDAPDELWPLRPRPCDGELLSSWLVRVARCYEMPVETFCREVWPGRQVWRRDIDRQIDDDALQLLSRKTGVSYPELFSMTLRCHEQYAGAAAGAGSTRDLYFHFGGTDYAIRFCPSCLAGSRPYYRLEWRLATPSWPRPDISRRIWCGGTGTRRISSRTTPEGNWDCDHSLHAFFEVTILMDTHAGCVVALRTAVGRKLRTYQLARTVLSLHIHMRTLNE